MKLEMMKIVGSRHTADPGAFTRPLRNSALNGVRSTEQCTQMRNPDENDTPDDARRKIILHRCVLTVRGQFNLRRSPYQREPAVNLFVTHCCDIGHLNLRIPKLEFVPDIKAYSLSKVQIALLANSRHQPQRFLVRHNRLSHRLSHTKRK